MKHHIYNPSFEFVKHPVDFNKYTEKSLLQYCLGATLYMPATKDFANTLRQKKMLGLTSMVLCFEDAVTQDLLPTAESSAIGFLDSVSSDLKNNVLSCEDTPLVFFRVRSLKQFLAVSKHLKPEHMNILTGFVFPKFCADDAEAYFAHLKDLNSKFDDILYAMPLLESKEIAFKETRNAELRKLKKIIDQHKDYTLNIRVGAIDFLSNFSLRRDIDNTIYDILPVADCLCDILNTFGRENDYVVSGPVWEYFGLGGGLLREVTLDKANGFVGKTIIHPSHLSFVNAMQAVTEEEYHDATQILDTTGGVIKSAMDNKMNEIKPHTTWAYKTKMRAQAYGVIKDKDQYKKLYTEEV